MFLTASNPALKCVELRIMESFLFSIGPTVTVILKKYFFQQKKTYLIKISSLTLGGGGEGVLLPGSLPSVAFSSHVRHILASSRLLRVLPIPAGPQAPFFCRTIDLFLFPQRCFRQHLRCDLGINSSL